MHGIILLMYLKTCKLKLNFSKNINWGLNNNEARLKLKSKGSQSIIIYHSVNFKEVEEYCIS